MLILSSRLRANARRPKLYVVQKDKGAVGGAFVVGSIQKMDEKIETAPRRRLDFLLRKLYDVPTPNGFGSEAVHYSRTFYFPVS